MATISGILTDGTGQIINDCTIELYAKKTTNKVLVQTQAFTVAIDGRYSMNVFPCEYDVSLIINGFSKKRLGTINVYDDSPNGTLNDYLTNPIETDVTPEFIKDVIAARNEAQKSADEAREWASTTITRYVGEFRLMPFRANELPFGWYFRNGDNYLLYSQQGHALNRLSANYKSDHQITIKTINGQQYINVPSAFAPDGRGFFERAVNGTTRQVGSVEDDAIRDIWGHFDTGVVPNHSEYARGAFCGTSAINPSNSSFQSTTEWYTWGFDFYASRVVPTANENRPINMGMTPAIYLGV